MLPGLTTTSSNALLCRKIVFRFHSRPGSARTNPLCGETQINELGISPSLLTSCRSLKQIRPVGKRSPFSIGNPQTQQKRCPSALPNGGQTVLAIFVRLLQNLRRSSG